MPSETALSKKYPWHMYRVSTPKKNLQRFKIKVKTFECFLGHPVNCALYSSRQSTISCRDLLCMHLPGHLVNIDDVRSLVRIRVDALRHQLSHTLTVLIRWQGRIVTLEQSIFVIVYYDPATYLLYLLAQRVEIHLVSIERRL